VTFMAAVNRSALAALTAPERADVIAALLRAHPCREVDDNTTSGLEVPEGWLAEECLDW